MESKEQIVNAIRDGYKVYWKNQGYKVIISCGELYTYFTANGFMAFLHDTEVADCFIKD